jgi:hypothetical protein
VQGRIDAADGQLKKLRMQLEAAQYGKKGDGELPPPGTFTSDNPAGVRFPTATPQRLLLLLCARYAVAALFLLCFLSSALCSVLLDFVRTTIRCKPLRCCQQPPPPLRLPTQNSAAEGTI